MRQGRQTRTRASDFSVRDADGERVIEGYFAVFDGTYQLWPGATESVDEHAFDDCLQDDVRALIDHETRLVLGRTVAGTLMLRVDAHGLWGRIVVNPDDADAMNLYARVKRGDVSQCSFGFDILDEERSIEESTGDVHWTIKKVRLYEVSCVTFPAYQTTEIAARKEEAEEMKRRQVEAWRAKQKARLM